MKITYVAHSCFTVELEETVLIFDYYKGELTEFDKNKDIYVFVSHKHHDHFNHEIFNLAELYPNCSYILSNELKMSDRYMERIGIPLKAKRSIVYIGKNRELKIGSLEIKTLKSTDEGVAFIIKAGNNSLYHAGDLNWWSWEGETQEEYRDMKNLFMKEMKLIEGDHFDVAFLPLDPRQEDRFWWGFDHFMRTTDTAKVFPMHFWEDYGIISKMKQMECSMGYRDKIISISKEGESFEMDTAREST